MKQSVCGIVKTNLEAENLVNALRANGFVDNEISALFPDQEGSKDFAHKNETKAPEGTVAGAGTGGLVGGVFGLLAGIGAIAIPGVGPLIAAGPIMATLSGAAVGATVGGIAGALVGMGIPEYEAKMYEGKIREGNILLAVHCNNNDELKRAEEVFKQYKVCDIHRVGEASVKKSA
jgi:uncharacterized membrane protein